jgi:hypothetical protein
VTAAKWTCLLPEVESAVVGLLAGCAGGTDGGGTEGADTAYDKVCGGYETGSDED